MCWRLETAGHAVCIEHFCRKALGRPRHRWEDNNGMDLRGIGCGGTG
jgi:hypothetical protein